MQEILNDDMLETEAAAKVLGVEPGTLEVWRSTKRVLLPYVKIGRAVRYRRSELQKFIEARTVAA